MKKADFETAILDKLRQVPLENRRQWKEIDLMIWWNTEKAKDSYLTWDGCKGDIWQHVNGLGARLIGGNAM